MQIDPSDKLYPTSSQNPRLFRAGSGSGAIQTIVSSAESLQENPRRGAIVDEIAGLRKLLVAFGKYGYVIHYVILEDDVVILRVYHRRENRPR
ncbi:MAG: type II toxin-antitoxin system RelE/ParE family toxin [Cyanobacteria bacterium J06633_8]